jgi:glycosyltransferase involved in cell wall biosynthesis
MDQRKRILHANINNLGGAFSVAYEAQQILQGEFIFDYYSPDAFVKNEVYYKLLQMGSKCVGTIKCKSHFLKQYENYRAFKKYLLNNNYEYVHIHADTAWKISVYYLAARRAGIKHIVVHSHSSGINGHHKFINYLLHFATRPIIQSAEYKCACSDVAAKWMYNTDQGIIFVQNGVDIERYSFEPTSRENIRNKYGIHDQVVVGSVSDYSYQKNPEFLFKLVKEFQNNPKYIFLFVGNRDSCLLKNYIDKYGEIKNVVFTGTVTNTEEYLSAMDIFVMPSRFEGLPMSALEAQVNGLYTIISDKITAQTQCSKYFERLPLDIKQWKTVIENVRLGYDRNNRIFFLDKEKASASNTADTFRKIYEGQI